MASTFRSKVEREEWQDICGYKSKASSKIIGVSIIRVISSIILILLKVPIPLSLFNGAIVGDNASVGPNSVELIRK